MNAIDTNVFLYVVDTIDPRKQDLALELLDRLCGEPEPPRLLWQVACEFLSGLRRRDREGTLTDEDVDRIIDNALATYPLEMPTPHVLEIARRLYGKYSLSHWDTLLIAACIDAGVETLYSEDMSHEATYDTVRVVNPFAVS